MSNSYVSGCMYHVQCQLSSSKLKIGSWSLIANTWTHLNLFDLWKIDVEVCLICSIEYERLIILQFKISVTRIWSASLICPNFQNSVDPEIERIHSYCSKMHLKRTSKLYGQTNPSKVNAIWTHVKTTM